MAQLMFPGGSSTKQFTRQIGRRPPLNDLYISIKEDLCGPAHVTGWELYDLRDLANDFQGWMRTLSLG